MRARYVRPLASSVRVLQYIVLEIASIFRVSAKQVRISAMYMLSWEGLLLSGASAVLKAATSVRSTARLRPSPARSGISESSVDRVARWVWAHTREEVLS